MRLEYDPVLVEKTVRLAARRHAATEQALHRQIDALYRIEDAEQRDRAFVQAFAAWFEKLALGVPITALINERSDIARQCDRCVVHEAPRRPAESAELFVRDGRTGSLVRTLVIQMLPETLFAPERAAAFFRRELLHVSDMLADSFGYCAEDLTALGQRDQIVRDRYRVLWDIYVESRLMKEGRVDEHGLDRLRRMFERAFTAHGRRPPDSAFDAARLLHDVTHARLLAMARNPGLLVDELARSDEAVSTGCPLCGFPTYDWFEFAADGGEHVAQAISAARPEWNPSAGACRQCVETYLAGRRVTAAC